MRSIGWEKIDCAVFKHSLPDGRQIQIMIDTNLLALAVDPEAFIDRELEQALKAASSRYGSMPCA